MTVPGEAYNRAQATYDRAQTMTVEEAGQEGYDVAKVGAGKVDLSRIRMPWPTPEHAEAWQCGYRRYFDEQREARVAPLRAEFPDAIVETLRLSDAQPGYLDVVDGDDEWRKEVIKPVVDALRANGWIVEPPKVSHA